MAGWYIQRAAVGGRGRWSSIYGDYLSSSAVSSTPAVHCNTCVRACVCVFYLTNCWAPWQTRTSPPLPSPLRPRYPIRTSGPVRWVGLYVVHTVSRTDCTKTIHDESRILTGSVRARVCYHCLWVFYFTVFSYMFILYVLIVYTLYFCGCHLVKPETSPTGQNG